MRLPRRGPDRPPRVVAGPSTRPGVICLSASVSPVDSLSRSGGVQKHGGRWWFVPGRYGLTASGCCVDPRPVPADALQSNAAEYAGAAVFGCPLPWRHSGMHAKPLSEKSAYRWYGSGCLETATFLACALTDTSAHAVP